MPGDSLAGLARELAAMPAGARRTILNALTATERAALNGQLADATLAVPARSGEVRDYSSWLAERIDAVRHDPGQNAPGTITGTITGASRQALLRSLDPDAVARPRRGGTPAGVPGRSLFGAVGGLLMPKTR